MRELIEENWRAIVAGFVFCIFLVFAIGYFTNLGNEVLPNLNAKPTSTHLSYQDAEPPQILAKDGSELSSMIFQVTQYEGGTLEPDHFDAKDYAMAIDAEGNDISEKLQVYGNIDLLAEGPQKIKYVVDHNGLKISKTISVLVERIKNSNKGDVYSITYNLNGGTLLNKKISYTTDTESFTLGIPTKAGYTFLGWVNDALPSTKPGNITIRKGTSGNLSFTAQWSLSGYNLILDTNYINRDTGNIDQYYLYLKHNEKYGEMPLPERKGYEFVGWYTQKSGGTKVTEESKMGTKSTTVYAHWNIIDYPISYDLAGGILNNSIASYNYETPTFSIGKPVRDYYNFIGWNVNGSSDLLRDFKVDKYSYGDLNLKANWEAINYAIDYEVDGGILAEDTELFYTIEKEVKLLAPTKPGYKFIGWYENADHSGSPVSAITKGTTGDKTFYAKWELETYSISYDLDGGMADGLITSYTINDEIALPTPTKVGYDFIGWSEDGKEPEVSTVIPIGSTGNKNYKAIWSERMPMDNG